MRNLILQNALFCDIRQSCFDSIFNVHFLFYKNFMQNPNQIKPQARRGRGALSNATGRFEPYVSETFDDGWDIPEEIRQQRTDVAIENPRRIITKNTSPDISFDQSINPYRGCEHGCIYCFARPSHAYLGLSPGLDFETKLIARPNAPELLARELARKSYRPEMIALGTNTDPYQPIEKKFRVMRGVLEVLLAYRHPVGIVTKGAALIERDIDILSQMAAKGLVRVGVSLTTLDPSIARTLEPRVPAPARRLLALKRLADAGVSVRAMLSPIIPGLTDAEIEALVGAASDAGAQAASMIPVRLPREVAPLFREWLAAHFPDRAKRIMARVQEMHGGQDYDARWHHRMRGDGEYARMLYARFDLARKKAGLTEALPPLRKDLFRVPSAKGDQLSFFPD